MSVLIMQVSFPTPVTQPEPKGQVHRKTVQNRTARLPGHVLTLKCWQRRCLATPTLASPAIRRSLREERSEETGERYRATKRISQRASRCRRQGPLGVEEKNLDTIGGSGLPWGPITRLAATLVAHHPTQVVITGPANDPAAQALEAAAHRVYRFGKCILRVTPETPQLHLAVALKETLPHLPVGKALAVVYSGQTCFPPTSDPSQLVALLENGITGAATI